jgi:hypothetical protein
MSLRSRLCGQLTVEHLNEFSEVLEALRKNPAAISCAKGTYCLRPSFVRSIRKTPCWEVFDVTVGAHFADICDKVVEGLLCLRLVRFPWGSILPSQRDETIRSATLRIS